MLDFSLTDLSKEPSPFSPVPSTGGAPGFTVNMFVNVTSEEWICDCWLSHQHPNQSVILLKIPIKKLPSVLLGPYQYGKLEPEHMENLRVYIVCNMICDRKIATDGKKVRFSCRLLPNYDKENTLHDATLRINNPKGK